MNVKFEGVRNESESIISPVCASHSIKSRYLLGLLRELYFVHIQTRYVMTYCHQDTRRLAGEVYATRQRNRRFAAEDRTNGIGREGQAVDNEVEQRVGPGLRPNESSLSFYGYVFYTVP